MALARFNIIVATDSCGGIAKNGNIPWSSRSDMKFFKEQTTGSMKNGKQNVVIMGRKTYLSIDESVRPLRDRSNIVISRTWRQEDHPGIRIYNTFVDALAGLGNTPGMFNDVYVIGGEELYREVIANYLYLCDKIYVTEFKTAYDCDQHVDMDALKRLPLDRNPVNTRDYVRFVYAPRIDHPEYAYLRLLRKVLDEGETRPDRTGTGTISLFGERMEFDLRDRLPILTTKQMPIKTCIRELLFFISGQTNTQILESQGVRIWKPNTSREFLDSRGLGHLGEGDMGAGYGFQWRHWGAQYDGCDAHYEGKGIDQLQDLVQGLISNPFSRRHILSAWNVGQLGDMALPPCHMMCQFYVDHARQWLDCQLYQRSGDMFLGVPFNIMSYAILTHMIAQCAGLRARKLVHVIGDAHIYTTHTSQVTRQLGRTPRPLPVLHLNQSIKNMDDFVEDHIVVDGYDSWPVISAPMAV